MTNNNQWYVDENGRIELLNFYLNFDFDKTKNYSYSEEALKTAVISSSLPVKGNRIIIDEDLMVFYEKIKINPTMYSLISINKTGLVYMCSDDNGIVVNNIGEIVTYIRFKIRSALKMA